MASPVPPPPDLNRAAHKPAWSRAVRAFREGCRTAAESARVCRRLGRWVPSVPARARQRLLRLLPAKLSLHRQVSLMLVGMSLVFIGGTCVIQSLVVMPAFTSLERQGAIRDVNRCVAGVNRDLELLRDLSNDWAAWDDSYRFVADRNPAFPETNLTKEGFISARVSVIALLNSNRELVWGGCYDLKTEETLDMAGLWPVLANPAFPLTQHKHVQDAKSGLLLTRHGPLMICASPIITSKRQGPVRGSLVMGRFLAENDIRELGIRAEVDMTSWPAGGSPLADEADILDQLSASGAPVLRVKNSRTLEAFAKIDDLFGRPGLLLRVNVPRQVSAQGRLAGRLAVLGSILGSLAVMTGAGFLIRRRVVQPLEHIVAHARHVGDESDLKARLNSGRNDELGELSRAFDHMVECLAASRRKVAETAHQAGMADVASEVLHNVGNVINSANASVEQLDEQLKGSKVEGLEKAAELLRQNSARAAEFFSQDPRGPKLLAYLVKISGVLRQECTDNQDRVARIRKAMRHIQEIIALQEQRAHRGSEFACETDLAETFRDVVTLHRDRLDRAHVRVEVRTGPLPELMLNRNKLTQVLINLVRNALQAMEEIPEDRRSLSLLASLAPGNVIEVEISDTGCGMSEEVRANLFQHGFTTKANGRGIGLHYCANAVRSMGGWISASSDGPGKGSSIHIRLPAPAADTGPDRTAKAA